MRGQDAQQGHMWSDLQPEQRVPQDHPLRPIRAMVDHALTDLSPRFALLYSHTGRPSIPPEQLLRALLLQAFYSVRRERQLMEQLDYNLLFRWVVGWSMDDPIWDPTVFSKNRDRLFQGDIAQAFFAAVLPQARAASLVSAEHVTVDGTLLEAWASHKSFRPKAEPSAPAPDDDPGNPTVDFRGEKRSNATHQSTVDADHFKRFNDTYGHDVGDQVLRMVASRLGGVSGGGKAFRYGGEEFSVIFPNKSTKDAAPHLEALRRAVAASRFPVRGPGHPRKKPPTPKPSVASRKEVSVTVSIDVADYVDRGTDPQRVLKSADKALYRAKSAGRNRVMF